MKMILLITLFIGVANAESQCMTKRVPGDKCAVVYLGEDCDDEGSQLEEGWGTVNPPSYRRPKNVVVRPGCKLVSYGWSDTATSMTFDAMNSNTHLWERLNEEEIEDFNCICTRIYPSRRSEDAE